MGNIILTGMPGAGKSTVGVVLAKKMGYRFMDSDLVIQEREGKLLHELIRELGGEGFLQLENEINASIRTDRSVIATGGVVLAPGQTLQDLYRERVPLYESYAHRVIDCSGKSIREIVGEIAG